MFRVRSFLGASALALICSATPAKAVDVYLFKGAGDFSFINEKMHFSRGLEKIRDKLAQEGVYAKVYRHGQTAAAMRDIKARKPKTVAFAGHSMGALASMSMARRMKDLGIKVVYVGTLDIPGPVGRAGANVEKAENYYSITPVYGLLVNASSHRDARNIHVFGTHTTMDDSKKVVEGVTSAILEIHKREQAVEPQIEIIEAHEPGRPQTIEPERVVPIEEQILVQRQKQEALPKIDEGVELAARAKPIANLQRDETLSGISATETLAVAPQTIVQPRYRDVSQLPASERPINLLAQPRANQQTAALAPQAPAPVQQPIVAPTRVQTTQISPRKTESRTLELLDRVRAVLKRNGQRFDQRQREISQ